jgi:hypothetical protein
MAKIYPLPDEALDGNSSDGVYSDACSDTAAKVLGPARAVPVARHSISPSAESMALGFTFRSIPRPQLIRSVVALIVFCSLLQLIVGAP